MKKIIHYLGLDVHKDSITIAPADKEEVRHYGKIAGKLADLDKLIKKLQKNSPEIELRFCYEAGPTGYGLYRHLNKRKFKCHEVVALPTSQVISK